MRKGEQTRGTIVDAALQVASVEGLEGLSIGSLAARLNLSKSGLFAHFGSKEALQLAVLEEAVERFVERIVRPALRQPRGLPRLEALVLNWLAWIKDSGLPGGCPIQAAGLELDDRPGPLRDYFVRRQQIWQDTLVQAVRGAVAEGHLRADTDPARVAFELQALAYGYGVQQRLMSDPRAAEFARTAFADLIARHRTADTKIGALASGGMS